MQNATNSPAGPRIRPAGPPPQDTTVDGAVTARVDIDSAAIEGATTGNAIAGEEPDIPNLTLVKDRIREYYGDHLDAAGRHRCSATSRWADDVAAVINRVRRHLDERLRAPVVRPALVLDIDDTALTNYDYLANTEFGSRRNREVLPAIVPTRDLARYAHGRGVAVFFLSERLPERRDETLRNLLDVGYPPPAGIYLRARTPPFPPFPFPPGTDVAGCPAAVYKEAARAYLGSLGYDVLATIGDQHSDIAGGHAERAFKLPNPMYHTP